jgi:xanthine dehydrogenase accessory factor
MLIGADGELVGTIGGGCGEAEVLETARHVIETGLPRLVRVDLTDDYLSWSPAVCGGVMEVFVEPVG